MNWFKICLTKAFPECTVLQGSPLTDRDTLALGIAKTVLYYHVSRAVTVVVALASEVVEADAHAAELLVLGAVVPVHFALLALDAPPEGDLHAPGWWIFSRIVRFRGRNCNFVLK